MRVRHEVHEIDEELIHVYHLFLTSMQTKGLAYSPTFGDWCRDLIFAHLIDHPEVLDLSTLLRPEERRRLVDAR